MSHKIIKFLDNIHLRYGMRLDYQIIIIILYSILLFMTFHDPVTNSLIYSIYIVIAISFMFIFLFIFRNPVTVGILNLSLFISTAQSDPNPIIADGLSNIYLTSLIYQRFPEKINEIIWSFITLIIGDLILKYI